MAALAVLSVTHPLGLLPLTTVPSSGSLAAAAAGG